MSICTCCGGPCKDGATYAPGHSAKHAANLAREVVAGACTLEEAQAKISTPKLRETVARYVESMSNPASRGQRQRQNEKKRKHDLKERSSPEIANAKHLHEPTPVDDCGYELARGVWCARKYPCPIKEHN